MNESFINKKFDLKIGYAVVDKWEITFAFAKE